MKAQAAEKAAEPEFTINVALGNDQEPVKQYINANGREFLLQRGVDVRVPKCVLNALDDAVIGVPEVDPNDDTKTIFVQRQRFPYTIKQAH